jgi:hypothetical protein
MSGGGIERLRLRRADVGQIPQPGDAAEDRQECGDDRVAGLLVRLERPAHRVRDVVLLAALFGITVGIAELAGAANLGVAFGIGQITFAIGLVVLLTRA